MKDRKFWMRCLEGAASALAANLLAALAAYLIFNKPPEGICMCGLCVALVIVILAYAALKAEEEADAKERYAKKMDLIVQMGSSVEDIAVVAAEELWRHGWLQDGSLCYARLQGANLVGAYLVGANLAGAKLMKADLRRARLQKANLGGAKLGGAKLQKANLIGANLSRAEFDGYTTLPDGTKWTPDTDMARFTDPDHPDFWRPDA